jgi:hypothetical protein
VIQTVILLTTRWLPSIGEKNGEASIILLLQLQLQYKTKDSYLLILLINGTGMSWIVMSRLSFRIDNSG